MSSKVNFLLRYAVSFLVVEVVNGGSSRILVVGEESDALYLGLNYWNTILHCIEASY